MVSADNFRGQFWINLPTKNRRLDFAIETPDGKRIAVELDGQKTHASDADPAIFSDHLLRQNEIVAAGWTIIRFSFEQLKKQPEYCRKVLKNVIENSGADKAA